MELFKKRPFKILTSDELLKKEFISDIVSVFYCQLIPRLLEKFDNDNEKVKEILMTFGRRVRAKFTEYWMPKKNDVKSVIKESYKVIMRRDLKKLIVEEKGKKWIMVDDNCVMCSEGVEYVGDVHYCTLMAGIIEGAFNSLRKKERFKHLPIVKAETIASRAHGDKDCRHLITVVE
ncbi:MAG: hypothetical protein ACTSO9_17225 [Candidatus Helarchaeota archaeon]